jgi:nucleoid DNA-binding protein
MAICSERKICKKPYFCRPIDLFAEDFGSTFTREAWPNCEAARINERILEMAKSNKTTEVKGNKPRTKSQILSDIAASTELSRKQVAGVFEAMGGLIKKDLSPRGPGIFTVPGLMKIKRIHKPATKAREGINPFTGQPTMFKAKPARNVVKVQPLKGLKAMV